MICRECRRAQYHARTPITPPDKQTKQKKAEFDDWLIKAEESYKRVLANRTWLLTTINCIIPLTNIPLRITDS